MLFSHVLSNPSPNTSTRHKSTRYKSKRYSTRHSSTSHSIKFVCNFLSSRLKWSLVKSKIINSFYQWKLMRRAINLTVIDFKNLIICWPQRRIQLLECDWLLFGTRHKKSSGSVNQVIALVIFSGQRSKSKYVCVQYSYSSQRTPPFQ